MKKKIPIKNLYLLLVISIGLIGLGIGSTYAVFTANAEIDSPIVLNSNLTHDSEVIETIEVEVPAGEIVSTTLNISNNSDSKLNYVVWYDNSLNVVEAGRSSGSPQGSLASGSSTTLVAQVRNNSDEDVNVTLGVSSSASDIILNNNMKILSNSPFTAYAVYTEVDHSLTFYKTLDTITAGSTYNGKTVTNVFTGFEDTSYTSDNIPWFYQRESIVNVFFEDKISPVSTAFWFYYFRDCSKMDLTNLDTSKVTSMAYMFHRVGDLATTLELVGFENLDTTKVTDMTNMFYYFGGNVDSITLDLSDWDVSSVTTMHSMFEHMGAQSVRVELNLSGWDTSRVTDMTEMFYYTAYSGKTFICNLSGWDLSNLASRTNMFLNVTTANGLETKMDLSNWKVPSNMSNFFERFAYVSESLELNLSNWDVSNVTNMSNMFLRTGQNSKTVKFIGLDSWNVSKVTSMESMFYRVGTNATTLDIGDISKWDTVSVTNMKNMFYNMGTTANYSLDLTTKTATRVDGSTYTAWNVSTVTDHSGFDEGVTAKIYDPSWVS